MRRLFGAGLVAAFAVPGLLVPAATAEPDPDSWSSGISESEAVVALPAVDPAAPATGEVLLCDEDKLKETLEKIALIKNDGLPALRRQLAALEADIAQLKEQGLKDIIAKHAWQEALAAWDAQLSAWTNRPSGSKIQHPEKLYGPRAGVEARLAEAKAAVEATKAAFDQKVKQRDLVADKIQLLEAILKALEQSLEGTSACNEMPATPVTIVA
jgi:hypothetical protein